MPKRLAARVRVAGVPQAQDFALPGLLPPHLRVLLDLHTRTALVLDLDPQAPSLLLHSAALSPSSAALLLALLQAYPSLCPYPRLYRSLYPETPPKADFPWPQAVGLRSIRRALWLLAPALRDLGLAAFAVRGRGYLLTGASAKSATLEARAAGGTDE